MAKCDVLDHSLLLNDLNELNELNYVKIITDHIADFFHIIKAIQALLFLIAHD